MSRRSPVIVTDRWAHALRYANRVALATGRRHVVKRVRSGRGWPLHWEWQVTEVGNL